MKSSPLQAKTIFEDAFGASDPAERQARIERACAGEPALRQEVESLLAAHDQAGSFLETPARQGCPTLPFRGPGTGEFGDYELLEEVARGGMGVVYKARQVSLNRIVAVKLILAGQFASEAEVKRFRSEARAAASLNHPNIVAIHEVGEHQGQQYYSMPFLEGRNLAQLVESGQWRPGDGTGAARLMAKVARAVQYAHEAGILHRDLKPGNVLLDKDGEPAVTDFGLAKHVKEQAHLTVIGNVMGTPGFMAPEQARGKGGQSTPAIDIYSLGAVLYYLLTGQPPFVADSALDALLLVLEGEAVLPRRINPRVPGALEQICLRCLEKRTEDRYGSAAELADDLEHFLKGEPLAGDSRAMGRRLEAWLKRQPALAARLGTVLLCLVIVLTAYAIRPYMSRSQHWAVIGALLGWLGVSYWCQWALDRDWHANRVRLFWSCLDPAVLTTILFIAQAFHSPLVILYPTVVAASGFWLRVPLVATATGMSLLGYSVLWLTKVGPGEGVPFHWHLLAIVAIVVTGLAVSYLVNRVCVLTRFYERRPAR